MVVSNDNQRTISKCSCSEGVMDSNDISVADTFPGLYSTYRVLVSQSEAYDSVVSFRMLR